LLFCAAGVQAQDYEGNGDYKPTSYNEPTHAPASQPAPTNPVEPTPPPQPANQLTISFQESTVNQGGTVLRLNGSFTASGGRENEYPSYASSGIGLEKYAGKSDPTPIGWLSIYSSSEFVGSAFDHQKSFNLVSGSMSDLLTDLTSVSLGPLSFNENYATDGGISFDVTLYNGGPSYIPSGSVSIRSLSRTETLSFSEVEVELEFDYSNFNQSAEQVVWQDEDGQQIIISIGAGGPVEDPNADALTSANTTGVAMGNYNSSAVNNITSTVLGGLHNGRIVRARSQLNNPRLMDTQSWVTADRSLSNYLNFAGNQGLSVRQALGLEDVPVASTVPGGSAPIMMGMAITSPKAPLDAKMPLEEPKRWELYTVGDIGDVDQDALDTVNRGYRNRTYAGSVGAEYFVSEKLNVGTAFSYADSDTDFSENLGSADIDGQMASVYATYFKNGAYIDGLYSFGAFDHDLVRTTLGGDSIGSTESNTHTFSVNAGQNFDYKGLVTGPTVGLDHSRGTIDAYTETGGLPLNFADRNFESTISSLGWQVSKTQMVNDNVLMLQASASWDHEYQPGSGVTRGSLVADPAVPFNGVNAGPGDNWLNVGLGLRLITRQGWDFEVDYQTQLLRDDVTAHFAGLKTSVRF
jgi:uncharacterized protein YhjY with autotransporter beta-barrel domain